MEPTLRLDKWLWAARFFKTRRLACDAIKAGKIKIDDQAAKPSQPVRPGSLLTIRKGVTSWTVEVLLVSSRRGPASEAQELYRETAASQAERQRIAMIHKMLPTPQRDHRGAPDKRQRRELLALKRHKPE